ncbi:MAG TPA: RsmD family RNA methyltransferase, partial [Polyangiaceae bacterium]|nr:RsmD family RNA methyltransferase [Polyangiaceae bacterium]
MLCPHSRTCPGCPLIERAYPAQLEHKRAVVARALARYAVLASPELAPTAPADPITDFRVRAKLVSDGRSLGLFARGSHRVVDIPECRIQRPRVLAVSAALRADLKALGAVSAFDLREADAGVLVTAAVAPEITAAERRRIAERIAARSTSIVSVAVSTRARDAPQVLGTGASVLVGPSELEHRPDPDAPFHYAAHGAFTQAHAGQLARLHVAIEGTLSALAKRHRLGTKLRVLELYAGSGALSLRLASRGFAVTLVETFAPAVRMAERAAAAQNLTLEARAADTASALATFVAAGSRFDAVIVNPP